MEEVMPWGIHEGKLLSEIPRGYLRWLARQEWPKESLRAAAQEILDQEPVPELAPPRRAWKADYDRSHLAPDLDARIHAVVRDAAYWLGQVR